jgi:hypothetical protein
MPGEQGGEVSGGNTALDSLNSQRPPTGGSVYESKCLEVNQS